MKETKDLSGAAGILDEFMNQGRTDQPPIEGADATGIDPFVSPTNTTQDQQSNVPTGEQVINDATPEPVDTAKPTETDSDTVSWDDYVDETPTSGNTATPDVNWSEVAKAIGIKTEVKSPEDVTNYVSTLEKQVQELKSTGTLLESVPTDLKEALEIAKQGGDYLAYLDIANVDYSKIDPEEIYEDAVAEHFYNPDGTFRQDEFDTYLEKQDPTDKRLRGLQIQKDLIKTQDGQKQLLKQRINAEKADNLKKLETSLNAFNKVSNFEVTPKIKKQLHDDLATGKFMKELGINLNGSHNWDSLLNAYFKAKYFDAVQAFNEKRTKTSVQRNVIDNLSNSTVRQASQLDNPTQAPKKKEGIDLYMESLMKK